MSRKRKADVLHLEDVQEVVGRLTDQRHRKIEELVSEHCGKIPYAIGTALQRAYQRGQIADLDRTRFRKPFQSEARTFLFKFFALEKEKKANSNLDGYIHTAIVNFGSELLEKTLRQEEEFKNSEDFSIQDESTGETPDTYRERDTPIRDEELYQTNVSELLLQQKSDYPKGQAPSFDWMDDYHRNPDETPKEKPLARAKPYEPSHNTLPTLTVEEQIKFSVKQLTLLRMLADGTLLEVCEERLFKPAWLEDEASKHGMTTDELLQQMKELQRFMVEVFNRKRRQQKKRLIEPVPITRVRREEQKPQRSLAEIVASPEWKGASNV